MLKFVVDVFRAHAGRARSFIPLHWRSSRSADLYVEMGSEGFMNSL